MKKYYHWTVTGTLSLLLLIVLSACDIGTTASTPTPTPTPKPKTSLEILNETNTKMNALHSLTFNGTDSTAESSSTGDMTSQATESGQESPSSKSAFVQMDGTISAQGNTISPSIALIVVDQKTYAQNAKKQGPWYLLNAAQSGSLGSNNIDPSNSSTIEAATASDVTDHGLETVNGKELRHLTIVVTNDKQALKKAFLADVADLKDLTQAQLDSIKLQSGTVDYWIDEGSMYIYKLGQQYTIQYSVDGNGTVTVGTTNLTKEESSTTAFSKFDVSATIKAPANAQSLDDITKLYI